MLRLRPGEDPVEVCHGLNERALGKAGGIRRSKGAVDGAFVAPQDDGYAGRLAYPATFLPSTTVRSLSSISQA